MHARLDAVEMARADRGGSHANHVQATGQGIAVVCQPTLPPPTSDFNRMVNQKIKNVLMKSPTTIIQGQNVKRPVGEKKQKKAVRNCWSLSSTQCGMAFLRDKICPQLGTNGANLLAVYTPSGGVSHIKLITEKALVLTHHV